MGGNGIGFGEERDRHTRDPRYILVFLADNTGGASEFLDPNGLGRAEKALDSDSLMAELSKRGALPQRAVSPSDLSEQIKRWPIGAVILDMGLRPADLYSAWDMLRLSEPAIPCLFIGKSSYYEATKDHITGGSLDEFVRIDENSTPEYVLLYLRALLLRAYPGQTLFSLDRQVERASSNDYGDHELICVFAPKGGTGKTTIACNIAYELSKERRRSVALIDGDLYFGDVDVNMSLPPGLDGRRRSLHTVIEALNMPSGAWSSRSEQALGAFDTRLLNEVLHTHSSGVRILPAPPRPEMAERIHPAVFNRAVELAWRQFDYTLVDMRSAYSEAEIFLLDQSTRIVLVIKPEMSCLRNATLFFDYASQFGWKDKVLLVLNRADSSKVTHITREAVEKHLGCPSIPVLSSGLIPQSACEGRPLLEAFPGSKVAATLHDLVEIIDGVIADETKDKHDQSIRRLWPGIGLKRGSRVTN